MSVNASIRLLCFKWFGLKSQCKMGCNQYGLEYRQTLQQVDRLVEQLVPLL